MKNIADLRDSLFDTIELLKKGKIDVNQAKAITQIGQVIVNSAKAETEFIKHNGGDGSGFIPLKVASKNQLLDRPKAEYSNSGNISVNKKYA